MRILYLLPHPNMTLNDPVGHAIRVRALIRGFEQLGGDVFVACAGESQANQTAKKIYRKGLKDRLPARLGGTLRDLFYIAHDHMFRRDALAVALAAQPLDFIVEHYTYFHQTGAYLARRLQLPLVLDDIPPIWEEEVYFRRDLRKVARWIQKRVFEQAAVLVAVSGPIRDYLLSDGAPAENVHIVSNGADCSFFRPGIGRSDIREAYRLRNRVVIGFVGSFAAWHGVDLMIRCATDLVRSDTNLHFLFVGDGPHRTELERQAHAAGLDGSVTFTGAIPFDRIPPFIDAMDIAVMPDSNSYMSPIKIYEYMAMEKAVVAPRLAPIEEIVTDGLDGVLFSPRDPDALRQALSELSRDEARRLRMGRAARRKIEDRFTWVKHADTICRLAKQSAIPRGRPR